MSYNDLKKVMRRVHGDRCVYENVPVDEDSASLDHVIPRHRLRKNSAERSRVLEKFGLPDDFDAEGLQNRVLTTIAFNRDKSDYVDGEWEEVVRKGLRIAGERLRAAEAELAYLRLERRVAKAWAELPPEACANAERLHDHLIGYAERWPMEEDSRDGSLRARRADVMVHAALPTVNRPAGTLLVAFRPLRMRDSCITFDHDAVLRLFSGYGAGVDERHRPFIVYADPKGPVTVQLGSDRLQLTRAQATDLCDVLDRAALAYLGAMRRLEEKVFESLGHPRARRGYLLGTTDRATWQAVMRYVRARDAESPSTEGFRAEGTGAFVVLGTHPNDPVRAPRTRISAEVAPESYLSRLEPEVRVCWDPLDLPGPGGQGDEVRESHYRTGVRWTCARTAAWFTEELLPRLAASPSSEKGWFRRRVPAGPRPVFRPALRARHVIPVTEGDEFRGMDSAVAALESMQSFFSTWSFRSVSPRAQRGVYAMLRWGVEHRAPGDAIGYVNATLPSSTIGTARRNACAGPATGWSTRRSGFPPAWWIMPCAARSRCSATTGGRCRSSACWTWRKSTCGSCAASTGRWNTCRASRCARTDGAPRAVGGGVDRG